MSTTGKILEAVGCFIALCAVLSLTGLGDSLSDKSKKPNKEISTKVLITMFVGIVMACVGAMMYGPFLLPLLTLLFALVIFGLTWYWYI